MKKVFGTIAAIMAVFIFATSAYAQDGPDGNIAGVDAPGLSQSTDTSAKTPPVAPPAPDAPKAPHRQTTKDPQDFSVVKDHCDIVRLKRQVYLLQHRRLAASRALPRALRAWDHAKTPFEKSVYSKEVQMLKTQIDASDRKQVALRTYIDSMIATERQDRDAAILVETQARQTAVQNEEKARDAAIGTAKTQVDAEIKQSAQGVTDETNKKINSLTDALGSTHSIAVWSLVIALLLVGPMVYIFFKSRRP